MKKNHEIRVKVSKDELESIRKKAEAIGMTTSGFLRLLGLSSKPTLEVH